VTPESTPDEIVVPDAVGKNYQQAQDLWRAAGLIVMPADDATGANRIPILDSNWYVVAQSPAAGSKVAYNSEITATIRKYTDD
jgi:beta-lactam-binding protein with PASTA domain